ncbi:lytic murein transglycosylase B [Cognatiluteimonas weifangensis]|uniref:Lytic murein transglycosylase B n=1 Tax=Cognatiluteimonas weifangensis TaxID=2303539 RepID=A0A372DPY1_9GAMM|nr:lytic murein transglycosylase B [Luteimonas weifangensis]RFP61615.1 lytic murein transglycosylase B [Luteimonas weifangensis]
MIRRATSRQYRSWPRWRPLAPALACGLLASVALAACATHAPARASTAAAPAEGPLLPPIPQPPERPLAPPAVTDPALPQAQRIEAFVDYAAGLYGLDPAAVRTQLAQARFQQGIVDAISRPAEKVRTWAQYRPIFLNDARIQGGRAFYAEHRAALDRVAARSGVPAEYIVAIIGVETSYGRITGKYRVLDALYTLAFGYAPRAPFFGGELAQLFALGKDEGIDVAALTGSYAGAMGWGQFMPSSWRNWGKDGDGDGRRDLIGDRDDIFASIANYFVAHGWQRGGAVVARAARAPAAADFVPDTLDPVYPLAALARRGYTPQPGEPRVAADQGATLLALDGAAGREYWLGYRNFYVITRYNRSPMYALAVHQLAQAIRAGSEPPSGDAAGTPGA